MGGIVGNKRNFFIEVILMKFPYPLQCRNLSSCHGMEVIAFGISTEDCR